MFDGILVTCIIMISLCLVAYLNRYATKWVRVAHALGYSKKEKIEIILARIENMKEMEKELDVDLYIKAKETFDL